MSPKFTTSIAEKTLSYHLLKNVPLKESILKVSGQLWTRKASILIYFKNSVFHASTDIIFLFIMFFVCVFWTSLLFPYS